MQTVQELLRSAFRHQKAGRTTEAERVFRQILTDDARHAECLHLLGMIACEARRHETAVDLIQKALAVDESEARYHSNLGNAFKAQGSWTGRSAVTGGR